MTVGESIGITPDNAFDAIDESVGELDTVFSFDHMGVDFKMNVIPAKFNLAKYKKILNRWQQLPKTCQPTIFLENHDQPRCLPRFSGDYGDRRELAGMALATSMLFMRATPYIYQGQEIGMTNCAFKQEDYKDIMSVNALSMIKKVCPPLLPYARKVLLKRARDHARTPMQWTAGNNAGFSTAEPWMTLNPNYKEINVEDSEKRSDSLLNFYRKALAYRKGKDVVINGDFRLVCPRSKDIFAYIREREGKRLFVVVNFKNKQVNFKLPKDLTFDNCALALSNYSDSPNVLDSMKLREYEAIVYEL